MKPNGSTRWFMQMSVQKKCSSRIQARHFLSFSILWNVRAARTTTIVFTLSSEVSCFVCKLIQLGLCRGIWLFWNFIIRKCGGIRSRSHLLRKTSGSSLFPDTSSSVRKRGALQVKRPFNPIFPHLLLTSGSCNFTKLTTWLYRERFAQAWRGVHGTQERLEVRGTTGLYQRQELIHLRAGILLAKMPH